MKIIGLLIGVAVWGLVDIYLGVKIKKVADSKKKITKKLLLTGYYILLGILAILIAISI